ncbi:hypothetical protein I601_2036 [Nocardioides dokdonensis FR1436]|uniref:Transglycosylase SLT domain-containing protein n=1 Tax=Nocardioides dokdonensis FR1436 TaxID=1300347 RepID=A0A1A9GJM6_9ACTN|nr:hypothetical protein [Nocardioides dokdonensis]ANH38464.1 hypothetical protein I601_2036 [Nocardioides dokdonensis FR1436]
MSKQPKYVGKHAAPKTHRASAAPRQALRTTVVMSTLAVGATGAVVTGGVAGAPATSTAGAETPASVVPLAAEAVSEETRAAIVDGRDEVVSRSDRRDQADPAKQAALSTDEGQAMTKAERLAEADPRDIGRALLGEFGFSADQFSCLDSLWVSESDWEVDADNPTSSAYGIPQALTELHELPADYMTSAESQIRWGLEYIQDSYGSPCSAWSFKQANNWY